MIVVVCILLHANIIIIVSTPKSSRDLRHRPNAPITNPTPLWRLPLKRHIAKLAMLLHLAQTPRLQLARRAHHIRHNRRVIHLNTSKILPRQLVNRRILHRCCRLGIVPHNHARHARLDEVDIRRDFFAQQLAQGVVEGDSEGRFAIRDDPGE